MKKFMQLQTLLVVALVVVAFLIGGCSSGSTSNGGNNEHSGIVTGRVTSLATGHAIEGVAVTMAGYTALTDAHGNYVLPGMPTGAQILRAIKVGYTTYTQDVTVVGAESTTVNFKMEGGGGPTDSPTPVHASLVGHVSDANSGAPISGAVVALKVGDTTVESANTNENGNYSFETLLAGTYQFYVSKDGYGIHQTDSIVIAEGQSTTKDVELLPYGKIKGVALHGRVNQFGQSDKFGGIHAMMHKFVWGASTMFNVTTDGNGEWGPENIPETANYVLHLYGDVDGLGEQIAPYSVLLGEEVGAGVSDYGAALYLNRLILGERVISPEVSYLYYPFTIDSHHSKDNAYHADVTTEDTYYKGTVLQCEPGPQDGAWNEPPTNPPDPKDWGHNYEDWYVIPVLAGQTLNIRIDYIWDGENGADLDLELFNSAGAYLEGSFMRDGGYEEIHFPVYESGNYYFKIYNFLQTVRCQYPYTIKITKTATN